MLKDKLLLRWTVKKLRGRKDKKYVVKFKVKVTKLGSTTKIRTWEDASVKERDIAEDVAEMEVHTTGRTRTFRSNSCSPAQMRQKHIAVKIKEIFERPSPNRKGTIEGEVSISLKRNK